MHILTGRPISNSIRTAFAGTTLVVMSACAPDHIVPEKAAFVADHHMHILSPEAVERSNRFCDIIGRDECGKIAPASTGADALRALDEARIDHGVLLSTAYMAGAPELEEPTVQLAADTRAENEFVVDQAAQSCGRLVAFISVNPNSPNALDEIDYWAHRGGASGLKLHLANSDFHFSDPTQVERLAAIFTAAQRAQLPIIIHLRNADPDFGAAEARIFLAEVLPKARGTLVQIAHSAGWGGADRQALSALEVFADAIATDPASMANVYFDMAVMPVLPSKQALAPDVSRYVDLMRKIGLDRFLLASDWTKGTGLNTYFAGVRRRLNLTEAEWRQLSTNAAPYIKDQAAPARRAVSGDRGGCAALPPRQ